MRPLVSLLFVGCLCGFLSLSGCDRPEHEAIYYGRVIDHLPDLPEAKESFNIPEIEGIDRDKLLNKRY